VAADADPPTGTSDQAALRVRGRTTGFKTPGRWRRPRPRPAV